MYRLGLADTHNIGKRLKDDFATEFEMLQESRAQTEADINARACEALKQSEIKLNANCPEYGLGKYSFISIFHNCAEYNKHCLFTLTADAETDIRQWHAHQLEREDALRRIEMNTIEELSVCWDRHNKKRTELIENHVSGLSVLFLSKGK